MSITTYIQCTCPYIHTMYMSLQIDIHTYKIVITVAWIVVCLCDVYQMPYVRTTTLVYFYLHVFQTCWLLDSTYTCVYVNPSRKLVDLAPLINRICCLARRKSTNWSSIGLDNGLTPPPFKHFVHCTCRSPSTTESFLLLTHYSWTLLLCTPNTFLHSLLLCASAYLL